MFAKTSLTLGGVALAVSLAGCAPTQPQEVVVACQTPKPTKHDEVAERERAEAAERQAFMDDAQMRLDAIDREMASLDANVQLHKGEASPRDLAAWNERLKQLKQQRAAIAADMSRASATPKEEWGATRGHLGAAIGSLELSLGQLREGETVILTKAEAKAAEKLPAGTGLCPVAKSKLKIDKQADRVIVTVRTGDQSQLDSLRAQAKHVGAEGFYAPAAAFATAGATPRELYPSVAVGVMFVDLADGVQIVLVPRDKNDVAKLKGQLDIDKKLAEQGRCASEEPRTAMR
jgi:hypothetical protein